MFAHSFQSQMPSLRARLVAGLFAGLASLAAAAQGLPPEVDALLARAKVPREAFAAIVVDAVPAPGGSAAPLLSHRAGAAMNPASVMKLVTTFAGLELLGPAFTWRTPVYLDGPVVDGVLHGNLIIQGSGDPKLVMERLWLLLRRVQALGVKTISGDIVLDRSAFAASAHNPADFDGEALRPYNVIPDALLVNYKSVVMTFAAHPDSGAARVTFDPPLAGVQMQASVPLSTGINGHASTAECGDYRAQLKPDFADPLRIAFSGSYPPACGEKVWTVAYTDPARYAERAVAALWRDIGGALGGQVRDGLARPGLTPAFEVESPPLAELIRDINKFSNNVMAQQLFLTFSLQQPGGANPAASGEVMRSWWQARFAGSRNARSSELDMPVLENGSGLSRLERVTPQGLARMLQAAYASAVMPELMASLPISGVDGTLKRSASRVSQGMAHLKSGSLDDVAALAGYVHAPGGRRLVVVGLINHPNAADARPALDALVDWAVKAGSR